MKITILALFILSISLYAKESDPYLGYWLTNNGKVIIEISKQENEYVGHVLWLKDAKYPKGDRMEGEEQVDRNNPDPEKRKTKVMGLKVVGNLKKEQDKLTNGWIYDSWNGKKYYCSVKIVDKETLRLRLALDKRNILGYSMKIKRVKNIENNNSIQ